MKRLLFALLLLLSWGANAQNINPQQGDVWTYFGPTLGGGWGNLSNININGVSLAAITAPGSKVTIKANGTKTAVDISILAGSAGNDYSGITSVLTVTPGTTMGQLNGIASYVYNTMASDGFHGNGISYYGICNSAVNGAYCWGINPVLIDGTYATDSGVGGLRSLLNELDFNILHTDTLATGLLFTGASKVTSPTTFAIIIAATDGVSAPTNPLHPWNTGITFQMGAVTNAMVVNPTGPGNSISTPPMIWNFKDAGGVARNYSMQATVGSFNFQSLLASPNWIFSGRVQSDSAVIGTGGLSSSNGIFTGTLSSAGFSATTGAFSGALTAPSAAIAGTLTANTLAAGAGGLSSTNAAFSGGLTVGAVTNQGAGTINTSFYFAGNIAGVTCAGAPTAGFTTLGGIVTTC